VREYESDDLASDSEDEKGYVQRKTVPLGALRIKRDHIRIANMFFQLL
jgi:hypothetical protein